MQKKQVRGAGLPRATSLDEKQMVLKEQREVGVERPEKDGDRDE